MKRLPILVLLVSAAACQTPEREQPESPESPIVGRWSMEAVYDSGEDVTEQHDPSDNRWVEFASDGAFVSDGDPYGRNTGRWTLDDTTRELYLDSDAGEGDDSYWIVTIEGDQMRWRGTRSEFTERFEILHARQ